MNSKQLYLLFGGFAALMALLFVGASYLIFYRYLHRDERPIDPDAVTYDIVFQNMDGSELLVRTYREGETVEIPEDPTFPADARYTYFFRGWDSAVETVASSDKVYTAVYDCKLNTYRVTFVDYDKVTVLYETIVEYGSSVSYLPPVPRRESDVQYTYTFAGWDKSIDFVEGDLTVVALYRAELRSYSVTFLNEDGSYYDQVKAKYGSDASELCMPPQKPSNEIYDYVFAGWKGDLTCITGDTVARATFTEIYRTYTVEFRDGGGNTIVKYSLKYGDSVTVPSVPVYQQGYGYFSGWDREIETVTGDCVYRAVYSAMPVNFTLTVNYIYEDGEAACAPYVAVLPCGSAYLVPSPRIPYYKANEETVGGELYSDSILTVVYSPHYTLSQDHSGFYVIDAPQLLRILSKDSSLWDKNYILTKDISMEGIPFAGIGSRSVPFAGVFDGNGHTVSGVEYVGAGYDSNRAIGFFNAVSGTVKNLNLEVSMNLSVTNSYSYVGGIVGELSGSVEGCSVLFDLKLASTHVVQAGGLVGRIPMKGTVSGCTGTLVMNVDSLYGSVGGVVGYASGATISGNVLFLDLTTKLQKAGEIVGEEGNNVVIVDTVINPDPVDVDPPDDPDGEEERKNPALP